MVYYPNFNELHQNFVWHQIEKKCFFFRKYLKRNHYSGYFRPKIMSPRPPKAETQKCNIRTEPECYVEKLACRLKNMAAIGTELRTD